MTLEFERWPSIARLNRDVVVTEKIDGTNAAILIGEDGEFACQSRTRLITPGQGNDNHGFAAWAYSWCNELAGLLGPGRHFGEWWGSGIQRGYGLLAGEKRFSLFNVKRWEGQGDVLMGHARLTVVPVLARGSFEVEDHFGARIWDLALDRLQYEGSVAAPGFMRPEGVVVYHTAARTMFKVTLEGDDAGKTYGA